MSWKSAIQPTHPVWAVGVVGYCDERIEELTLTCIDGQASDLEIRQAQKAIEELKRLKALPDTLRATSEINKSPAKRRGEY